MRGQTAVEYLMTYGWAILIILIVAGVLAYYGIFAPAGFLGPTARGFGQVQVLSPWSLATTGTLTLNVENRVGKTINVTQLNATLDENPYNAIIPGGTQITSGSKGIVQGTFSGLSGYSTGDSYSMTLTIYYDYEGATFSSTGTLSGSFT